MRENGEVEMPGDLYDILDSCTNDDLGPLVETLVSSPVSLLKISRGFEKFRPDHVRYSDQIGDDIYRMGLMALGRSDGKRPTYNELLLGLCKQIGISAVENEPEGSEALLLNTFSTQHLSSLPSGEQQQLVDEACVIAASAAKGLLSSDAWPPLASALLQVAYIRRRLAEEGRISPKANGTALTVAGDPFPASERSSELVVQTDDGGLTISLASLPDNYNAGWNPIDQSAKLPNFLFPIIRGIEPLVSASQILGGKNLYSAEMVLSYSEKVGGFVSAAKGTQGFVPLQQISVASVGGPAAIAAFAVAYMEQKRFEKIERSLGEIQFAIKDVAKFQQNERRSVLTGSIRYFQQIAPSVIYGELANEVLHEIERHEVELGRVQEHLIWDVQNQITVLRGIKKDGWGTGNKYANAIQEAQANLKRMYEEVFLCIRARSCGYQLLCAYPGREIAKRARFDDINRALNIFSPNGEATISMDKALREKVLAISSYETKAISFSKENSLFALIDNETKAITEAVKIAMTNPSEPTETLKVELKIEDGRLVAMR